MNLSNCHPQLLQKEQSVILTTTKASWAAAFVCFAWAPGLVQANSTTEGLINPYTLLAAPTIYLVAPQPSTH